MQFIKKRHGSGFVYFLAPINILDKLTLNTKQEDIE